jgi:hypothetical protein
MVVTNPLDEINDFVLADARDSECSRSVTQEEELGSNPFDGEGTQPDESTSNFTRQGDLFEGEGTRPTESTSNFTCNRNHPAPTAVGGGHPAPEMGLNLRHLRMGLVCKNIVGSTRLLLQEQQHHLEPGKSATLQSGSTFLSPDGIHSSGHSYGRAIDQTASP